MNRDLLIFALVIVVAGLIGGFAGGEWSSHDRIFSPTGAIVGAVGLVAVLLGLGAVFDRQERKTRQNKVPSDIRGVFDRMIGRRTIVAAPTQQRDPMQAVVEASLRRKKEAIDPSKIQAFVSTMKTLGALTDPIKTAEFAKIKLLTHHDPVIAALKAQGEFLDVLLNSSRGNSKIMGTNIANSCFGVCELVVDGRITDALAREYFISYIKVFERVHGLQMPFQGGPLDFDTSLELVRENRHRNEK